VKVKPRKGPETMKRQPVNLLLTGLVAAGVFGAGSLILRPAAENTGPRETAAETVEPAPTTVEPAPTTVVAGVDNSPEEIAELNDPESTNPTADTAPVAPEASTPSTPPRPTTEKPTTGSTPTPTAPKDPVAFPETSPIRPAGAEMTLYMAENPTQASLFGLEPEMVRTWVYQNTPGQDPDAEYAKLKNAITASGAKIVDDELTYTKALGGGSITGYWKGINFMVTVVDWTVISVSLIAR
jgi:hypothetical protein